MAGEGKFKSNLTDDDKLAFARNVFAAKQAGKVMSECFREANAALPRNKRLSESMNCVSRVTWIVPLLDKLEKEANQKVALTDEDKKFFAQKFCEIRKNNPDLGVSQLIRKTNELMPSNKKIGASISSLTQVPGIQKFVAQAEEATGGRVAIDHRVVNNKQPVSSTEAPPNVRVIPEGQRERKKVKHRVVWSDEEKLEFAQYVYEFRISKLGWGWDMCMKEANKLMPAHKQKDNVPHAPSQIPWLSELLDRVAKEARKPKEAEPVAPVETAAQPQAQSGALEDMLIGAFVNALKTNAASLLNPEKLQVALAQAMSPGSQPTTQAQPPKKKKVVVVGLLGVQTNGVQKEFGSVFDFKFIDSNTPSQYIRDAAKHADHAICMTQFVSHSTVSALRGHPGFMFCNGNSTALKTLLQEKVSGS